MWLALWLILEEKYLILLDIWNLATDIFIVSLLLLLPGTKVKPSLSNFYYVVVNVFVHKLVMYLLLFRLLSIVLLMDLLSMFLGWPRILLLTLYLTLLV